MNRLAPICVLLFGCVADPGTSDVEPADPLVADPGTPLVPTVVWDQATTVESDDGLQHHATVTIDANGTPWMAYQLGDHVRIQANSTSGLWDSATRLSTVPTVSYRITGG